MPQRSPEHPGSLRQGDWDRGDLRDGAEENQRHRGYQDNDLTAPERSVWIAGIGRTDAVALGVLFGQNAIVVGTYGGIAELVNCREAGGDA
jgi:hypothetical protein